MAAYGWIYANAKIKGDMGDYHIRRCDAELAEYQSLLTTISRSMLAVTKRYGEEAERQQCWFAGFLDKGKQMYALAVAGKQEQLLGMTLAGGGFRQQYCVLAYVFTNGDIRIYGRREDLFKPLAENLREIQRSGRREWGTDTEIQQNFQLYAWDAGKGGSVQEGKDKSILESSASTDLEVWECSLQRPVATGLLDVDEAGKILAVFPDGVATVAGRAGGSYREDGEKRSSLKERFEKEDEEKKKRKQEQEYLKLQAEEGRKMLEAGISQAGGPVNQGGGSLWKIIGSVGVLGGILALISSFVSCVA